MTTAKNQMEIREADIQGHYAQAYQRLSNLDHAPRIAKPRAETAVTGRSGLPGRRAFRSTTPGLATARTMRSSTVDLTSRIAAADDDDPLISPVQASVLHSLRRALATADAVVDLFADQTPLGRLKQQNLQGALAEADRTAFGDLLAAASLIALHTFANMALFLLANQTENSSEREIKVEEVKEILLDNPSLALAGVLWELDQVLAGHADEEADVVPAITSFLEALLQEVEIRSGSAPATDAFTSVSYRVAADDFVIEGFTPSLRSRSRPLTMTFKKPNEVVGNHIAKYQSLKLAKMMMAYDFDRQLNPFAELGGFIFTFMGDGKPGTGKTTLIQMIAGLLSEYCDNAGYPFRYENLSSDSIDSYQGKSAQNAKAFVRNILDPHVIGFGTIDDIDQIAGKRGDRQSSAGQQEITAVLMESFAGANTVVRGNCTFGMFSNYPENVDDALRQRAGARFLVDGPKSREDYIDILALLLGKNHSIPVGDHKLYAAQEIRKAVARSYEAHSRPQEDELTAIFERVHGDQGPLDTIEKLGTYLKAIQDREDRFTGRAVKNITDGVKMRAMDFELPDEWMEDPDLFLRKDYETKKAMISELMVPITPEMVIQEINRYADSEFRYSGTSDEAAIAERLREMRLLDEARRRYAQENGGR
jgi:hypothetical protein